MQCFREKLCQILTKFIKYESFRKCLVKRATAWKKIRMFFLILSDLDIFYNLCCKCNVWIQSTIEFTNNTLRSIHMEAISTNRGAGMYGDMRELSLPNFDRSFLIYFHFDWTNFMKLRIWPKSSFKTFRRPCSKAFTPPTKTLFSNGLTWQVGCDLFWKKF